MLVIRQSVRNELLKYYYTLFTCRNISQLPCLLPNVLNTVSNYHDYMKNHELFCMLLWREYLNSHLHFNLYFPSGTLLVNFEIVELLTQSYMYRAWPLS